MQTQVEEEISLKELILVLIKYRNIIIGFALVAILLSFLVSFYLLPSKTEAKVFFSLKFAGIEKGQYPDGTDFDQYEIAKPQLITKALQALKLEGELTVNDVRDSIKIDPVITEEYKKMQEYALEKEGKTLPFYPTNFSLSIQVNEQSGISKERALSLADVLIDTYSQFVIEEYAKDYFYINDRHAIDYLEYDYSDISMILHAQIDSLTAYNMTMRSIAPDFRSKKTGLNFNDILESVRIIDDIDLNRMDSMISLYRLTKDEARLKIYYEYLIKQLEYRRALVASETESAKNMLSGIENTSNNAFDLLTGNVTEEQSQSYFTQLILRTASVGTTAADLSEDIIFYQNELDQLLSGESIAIEGRGSAKTEVEKVLSVSSENLKMWQKSTEETSKEYYATYLSSMVKPYSPSALVENMKMNLNIAIGAVLGLMLGVFYAFFKDYWKRG